MKNRKTKPDNLRLGGRLNPGFEFEKLQATQIFGQTPVANPTANHSACAPTVGQCI